MPFLVAASSHSWQFFGSAFAKAREVIAEAALAHSVRDKTEGAYTICTSVDPAKGPLISLKTSRLAGPLLAYSLAPLADSVIQAPTRNALSLICTKRSRT